MHKGPAPLEQQGEGGSYRAGRATGAGSAPPGPRPAGARSRRPRGHRPAPPPPQHGLLQHRCLSETRPLFPIAQKHTAKQTGTFQRVFTRKKQETENKGPTGKAAQPCAAKPRGSVPRHSGERARAARCTVLCPRGFRRFHHCLHISFVVLVCSDRCFAMMGWGQVQDFPALSLGNHQLMRFC